MIGYRLYLFDMSGPSRGERITTMISLDAQDEATALREAHMRRAGRYAELWHFDNVVRIFEPES